MASSDSLVPAPPGSRPATTPVPSPVPGVALWVVALLPDLPLQACELACLSPDERCRYARFRFARHARAFARRRSALRLLIADRTGLDPREVRFRYSPHGRPSLHPPGPELGASHSHVLALVALGDQRRLGVDLERLRPVDDAADLARRFFAPGEQAALATIPEPGRSAAFLRCWTRKEAYLKAVGDGLSMPLDSFEVALSAEDPRLLRRNPDDTRRWRLHHLDPADGYVGALCLETG